MPVSLDTLRAQPLTLIQPATQALANGGSINAWRKQMEIAIRRSQTAAYIAATAERLGVSPKAIRGLSKAERAELDKRIDAQLKYLDGFVADLKAGKLTMAQAQARANLYAGATTQGYYAARWGDWIIPEYLLPGNQICKTNCKCRISVAADSKDSDTGTLTREMGAPEKHCTECPPLVGSYEVKRKRLETTKEQTDQEKAMFAAMGGGGSGGGSGGGGKSTLWNKGPDGKRVPQAGFEKPRSGGGGTGGSAKPQNTDATDRSLRRAGLITSKKMTPEEERSLHWYQSAGHDRINAELRGNVHIRDQYTLDMTTRNLDSMMDRSKLKYGVDVHRGVFLDTDAAIAQAAHWQPGTTFRDAGYVSTTASQSVANRFGGSQISMRIHAPAGTPAIYMPTARPLSMVSRGTHNEYELLLGRDLQYRVLSRHEENGKTVIEVEVVP